MGDKIKTLSQAIRLGATFRPQSRECYFHHHADGSVSSCALGAAIEAVTGHTIDNMDIIRQRFEVGARLENEIVNMNDKQGMTREAIADLLESQGL